MKIDSISIKRFRSINSVELRRFGGFNVLIGKNNSGKSNILSAIDTFFNCLQDGRIATLEPPFGDSIDFFDKDTNKPIQITVTFLLSLPERDVLLRDITAEAPQMQNATESIGPEIKLLATVNITPSPRKFAFVSNLALQNVASHSERQPHQERVILSIGSEAANELHSQLTRSLQLNRDIEALKQINEEERIRYAFNAAARSEGTMRRSVTNIFRDIYRDALSITPELRRSVETSFDEATTPEEFKRLLHSLATSKAEEAEAISTDSLKTTLRTFAGQESKVPGYVQKLLAKIAELKVLHLKDRRDPIGNEEAERILRLKTQRGGLEKLRDIQEPVETLLGVKIDAFESGDEVLFPRRSISRATGAELDVDNFLVAVNGSGIKEALRVILDVEFEKPDILLVEEPEIHLHPALETSMMRYLKKLSSNHQIFLTTHSTNFLDTAEMKNVYLISKTESTQVQHINLEEAEAQVPKELGLRLSSLFMFDRFVFVEGKSDEGILREWASKIRVNFSQCNVGFVVMEGVQNFAHYAQERTFDILTKRQVKILFLIDRDEREEAEVAKLKSRCGDNAEVVILERREIENYLLCPRAITEFIKAKKERASLKDAEVALTESNVKVVIEECAEQLKQFSIEKRVGKMVCKPFYPSRARLFQENAEDSIVKRVSSEITTLIEQLQALKDGAVDMHHAQVEFVNNEWDKNKLSIVPGDMLLDKVCQKYGVRFRKEQDGPRLAALMTESEINPEIREIIKKIVT